VPPTISSPALASSVLSLRTACASRPRQRRADASGYFRRDERDAQSQAREPVELAERAQHHDVAAAGLVGDAHAVWADIHEGLIDQEQAAAPAQTIGEGEQGVPAVDASIGVVGIDDNGNAGLVELADLCDLDHFMAGKLGRARVLRVGRRQDRGAAARQQKRRLGQNRTCEPGPATTWAGDGAP